MRVVGTAGHVDHGKSTLVKVLTGIDPDRLREEKERGMTIDLGFAWLTLPSKEPIGIVDVPGHIDFIKNMLAGVGSVDAAILVVAADEGVMPQTREHLDILDLLHVSTGVVAITKADLAEDQDWLELVQADVAETLAGTVLSDAPIVPVATLERQGIPELLQTLTDVLAHSPTRPDKGRPRLFMDRIFTVSGFGTVVTGTLIDGVLNVGQEVEILPRRLKARIRGLQSHKKQVEQAFPGSRVAINLTGVSLDDVQRGDVVTLPDWLEPSQLVDTRLRCLPTALRPLKHNQEVAVFSGAMEATAHLRLLGTREILPEEEGWVQLRLTGRVPLVKGDRFIVRQISPSLTIGGGIVVDPLPRRRHRRFRPELISRLDTLAHGTSEDLLLETLDRLGPVQVRHLVEDSPLDLEATAAALGTLLNQDQAITIPQDETDNPVARPKIAKIVVASNIGWQRIVNQLDGTLATYHQAHPLRVGMPRGELRSRLQLETGLFNKVIAQADKETIIQVNEAYVWLSEHRPQLSQQQQTAVDTLLSQCKRHPFATPSMKESLTILNNEDELLTTLIETQQLIRLSPDVIILPDTFDKFSIWLKDYIIQEGSITVAQVRDAFDTSRKYALALLEYTDAQRITRRVGDARVLVK